MNIPNFTAESSVPKSRWDGNASSIRLSARSSGVEPSSIVDDLKWGRPGLTGIDFGCDSEQVGSRDLVCCWLNINVGHFTGRLLSVLRSLISPVQSHPRLEAAGTIAGEQVIVSSLEAQGESIEALAAHPEVARFIMWVARQPPTTDVCVRRRRC